MEELLKKVAYLKGFADGLDINEKTDEGKLLKKIVDTLDEMADCIADLSDEQDAVIEQLDAVDEDLGDLEDEVYGEDEDGCCSCDDDEMVDAYEIECPTCHSPVVFDEDILDGDESIICPECGEEIELDFDCDCGDDCGDGCDCGCDKEN